jgi:hypothetical protein
MIVSLLAALLALPAAAQVVDVPAPCPQDAMTQEWQTKSFALWLIDGTNPDAAPRTATLKFKNCVRQTEYLGERHTPQDARWFVSEDGKIGVIATVLENELDATYITIVTSNNGSLTTSAQLGAYAHRKIYFKGIGADKVTIQDWRDGRTVVKNVFLIPTDAIVKP